MYQRRPIVYAFGGILVVWLIAWCGFSVSKHARVTADEVTNYLFQVDLARLSEPGRVQALKELARLINALTAEERRDIRLDGELDHWLKQMTEEEKEEFIEATLPTNFRQMLSSFERLPENKRRYAVRKAIDRLKQARQESGPDGRIRGLPELTTNLQERAVAIGLTAYFTESSAQAKAELAPLLEEIQRVMETGRVFRGK